MTGRRYGANRERDGAMRVLAEHARGTTFLICDGVVPSNEGRGYVLRRILRRAVTYARRLGVRRAVLVDIAETVIENMKGAYPDLERNREFVLKVIEQEEERFHDTLDAGMAELEAIMNGQSRVEADGHITVVDDEISPSTAFMLYDTYGFPAELTQEFAAERGFRVDMVGVQQGYGGAEGKEQGGQGVWEGQDGGGVRGSRGVDYGVHGLRGFDRGVDRGCGAA